MLPDLVNARGERLDFSFHPGAAGRRDLLAIGHGVTGNKDRPFAGALARAAAANGIAALRFSFAGNGASQGRFEEATVTKEVEDLRALLAALADWRVAYAGHSMGAAVGLLCAASDARIELLVSLAGMLDCASFCERKFGHLTPGGDCMWDEPECPLSAEFVRDMQRLGNLAPVAARVRVPWLLVHGTADEVVPLEDAETALAGAPGPARLVVLSGADHVFSGSAMPAMTDAVVSWLDERFAELARA